MELKEYKGPKEEGMTDIKAVYLHPGDGLVIYVHDTEGVLLRKVVVALTTDMDYEIAEHSEACIHGCPPPLVSGTFRQADDKPSTKGPRMDIFTMDGKGKITPLGDDLMTVFEKLFGPVTKN